MDDKLVNVGDFTIFMWLKNLSNIAFDIGMHKHNSIINNASFQFAFSAPSFIKFAQSSIGETSFVW